MSTVMRVRAALLAGVAVVALLATGAATASRQHAQVTSIRVLTSATSQDAWNAWVKNFEKANPSIDVQLEFAPVSGYPLAILTQLQAGNGPDIMYTLGGSGQIDSALNLADAGRLANLAKEPWVKRLSPAARPLVTQNKKVYALPLGIVPHGVNYNVQLFRDLGLKVPTTFEQLLGLCGQIKAKGKTPFAIAGAAVLNTGVAAQIIATSTVYAKDPNWNAKRLTNRATFSGTPAWHTTLQRILDMKNAGCFGPEAPGTGIPQMFAAVATGQAVMQLGPSLVIGQAKAINPNVDLAQFPFPGQTAKDTRAMAGYTDSVAVNAASSHKAEAIKFVDFIAREGQSRIYTNVSAAVSLHDANVGKLPATARLFTPYFKAKKVVPNPNTLWINADVYTALGAGVTGLLTGQSTVDGVLQAMDAAWSKGAS